MRLLDRRFVGQMVARQVDLMINGDDDRFENRRDARVQRVGGWIRYRRLESNREPVDGIASSSLDLLSMYT